MENSVQSTIYDDVWRTELCDMLELVIPVVNEVFGESFPLNARIEHLPDTHEFEDVSGRMERRTTDSCFRIYRDDGTDSTYHIECQSTADSSMLVRIFEYGVQIALDDAEETSDSINLVIPHSAVLFLRSTSKTPDKMQVKISTPGGCVRYFVPVLKMKDYTLDSLFEKNLFMLLPFYLFSVEKSLQECDENPQKLRELLNDISRIAGFLSAKLKQGVIDTFTKRTLIRLLGEVNKKLAYKYSNILEGVEEIMGGKVLEYEEKDILRRGLAMGRAEERISSIKSLMKKMKLSAEDAMRVLDIPPAEFGKYISLL